MKSWNEKRKKVIYLVKKVSEINGGDDIDWLEKYCNEIIVKYNIDDLLACWEDLYKQCNIKKKENNKDHLCRRVTCSKCGYNPHFCSC